MKDKFAGNSSDIDSNSLASYELGLANFHRIFVALDASVVYAGRSPETGRSISHMLAG
jgi:hypothetical protein